MVRCFRNDGLMQKWIRWLNKMYWISQWNFENSFFVFLLKQQRFQMTWTIWFDVNPCSNNNARKLCKKFGFQEANKPVQDNHQWENFRCRNVNLLWFGMGRNRSDEQTHTHSSTHIHISWNLRSENAVAQQVE